MSWRSENRTFASNLCALMYAAVILGCCLGYLSPWTLAGVMVASILLDAFNTGLENNPRNRV